MKKLAIFLLVGTLSLYNAACDEEFWEDINSDQSSVMTEDTISAESFENNSSASDASSEEGSNDASVAEADASEKIAGIDYTVYGSIEMNTVALDGSQVTNENLEGYKVTMVNIWAPWCGPCVGEMPELEELYKAYKDKGFQILGAVPDLRDPDMQWAIDYTGITYPVIAVDRAINAYATEYVPTTFFLDEKGNVLSSESFIGARSYDDWEAIVKEYLAAVSN